MKTEARVRGTEVGGRNASAFSLMEVMIACGIFFMATFSILALVSRCLAQARALQPMQVDANMVAAELSLPPARYSGRHASDFYAELFSTLRAIPGVTAGRAATPPGSHAATAGPR